MLTSAHVLTIAQKRYDCLVRHFANYNNRTNFLTPHQSHLITHNVSCRMYASTNMTNELDITKTLRKYDSRKTSNITYVSNDVG